MLSIFSHFDFCNLKIFFLRLEIASHDLVRRRDTIVNVYSCSIRSCFGQKRHYMHCPLLTPGRPDPPARSQGRARSRALRDVVRANDADWWHRAGQGERELVWLARGDKAPELPTEGQANHSTQRAPTAHLLRAGAIALGRLRSAPRRGSPRPRRTPLPRSP